MTFLEMSQSTTPYATYFILTFDDEHIRMYTDIINDAAMFGWKVTSHRTKVLKGKKSEPVYHQGFFRRKLVGMSTTVYSRLRHIVVLERPMKEDV